jgi:hypothetical protein
MEKHCRVCFQPDEASKRILNRGDGCPLLVRAGAGKLPHQWKRRRNAQLSETYRCSDFIDEPPVNRRTCTPADTLPMFDVATSDDVPLVPVKGWPSARDFGRKLPPGRENL